MTVMTQDKTTVSRPMVGCLSLVCLTAGAALWIASQSGSTGSDEAPIWPGAFIRVGALLAAFWLALPSRGREAAWARVSPLSMAGFVLAIVGLAIRPKIAVPILIVLAIAAFVLRPRPKQRPNRRADGSS